ncbi:MAG: hypothetical protein CTY36_11885 [Methylocystis sp.]|uniref:DUF2501 domain-containing protein n=1 Tax=Methylocystis rosea TaxID=173366 RepID=A0A3G8M9V3_9HYPH|nr:hypothetical protein [Methylocystis rosea]AZG78025.1 hypothetical protein EHO51_15475 [Methylocystis rosea]PPC95962.1 MAG: hypothetical protein CTY36_11885 [Methylocystis sp.]
MKIRLLLIVGAALGFAAPAMSSAMAAAAGAILVFGKSGGASRLADISSDAAEVVKVRGVSGSDRASLISGGMKTCVPAASKQLEGNEEALKKAGVSAETIRMYCECALNYAADNIEPSDAINILKGDSPSLFLEKVKTGASECAKSIFKK